MRKTTRYSGKTYFDLLGQSTYAKLVSKGKELGEVNDSKAFEAGMVSLKKEFDSIPVAIINRRDDYGRTAFARCMVFEPEDHIHFAQMLIDAGCKTNTIDMDGFTPCGLLLHNHGWEDVMLMAHMLIRNGLQFTPKEMEDASKIHHLSEENSFSRKIAILIKYIEEEKIDEEEEEERMMV